MKISIPLKIVSFFLFALVAIFTLKAEGSLAAARTWTGAGGNTNLATAGNWSPSGAPATGDTLTLPFSVLFSDCSNDKTLNNNIDPAAVTLAGISFIGSMPADCYKSITVSGNDVKLTGDLVGAGRVTLQSGVIAAGDIEIDRLYSTGLLQVGSHSVTLSNSSRFGSISGSGTLTLGDQFQGGAGGGCGNGQGSSYPITGDGSGFSGSIISNEMGLTVSSRSNDVARHASQITINNGGYIRFSLNYHEDMTFAGKIILNGGRVGAGQANKSSGNDCLEPSAMKDLNLTGQIQINQTATFSPHNVNVRLGAQTTGADKAVLSSGVTGRLTLPNGSVSESEMAVHVISNVSDCNSIYSYTNHKSIVNADCSEVPVYVEGGVLAGAGKVGAVTVREGGKIAPGNSPGVLSTGNLIFEESGIYEFEIAGSEPGQYDQINVTGTVALGNGTLQVIPLDFTPTQGQQYIIIANDGDDAVEGTFAGLDEGATVEVNGEAWFTISYKGGDGNDVVLTTIPGVGDAGEFRSSAGTGFVIAGGALLLGIAVKSRGLISRVRR